jgi:5-methylcytosine-specific restriction enzyme A
VTRRPTGFSPEVVELVTMRSGYNCEVMATGCTLMAEELHHRRPRGMGGSRRVDTNTAANALAICRRCHNRVESMRNWARDNGFVIPQHADPAVEPVWWRCNVGVRQAKIWVLLSDNGHRIALQSRRPA